MRIILAFLVVTGLIVTGCSNAEQKKKDETGEALQELKKEMNEVGDAIGDLFRNEQDNFKESANEVLDDLDSKVSEFKEKLKGEPENKSLEDRIYSIEEKTDALEKELNKLDENAEEEWAQTRDGLEKKFKALKKDLKSLSDEKK